MAGVYSPAFLYANPIPPIVTKEVSPCQEVVHKATDPDFDLYRLVPAPTNTPDDAGPYITLGMCYATHPDTGRSRCDDSSSVYPGKR